ncbi:MAG TPA: redoxin domain-containing protein [Nevskiaceae bacterium]|nr:redoxin domain-containing protein [Nevskiaceae bacterium]
MDFQVRLDRERARWLRSRPATVAAEALRTREAQRLGGVEALALREGERAPGFALEDGQGRRIELLQLIERGPAVLLFDRGLWCPFCALTLTAFAAASGAFDALRVPLVAIVPAGSTPPGQTAPEGLCLLQDPACHITRAYGLAVELAPEQRDRYHQRHGLPAALVSEGAATSLSLPASFIVLPGGWVWRAALHVEDGAREGPQPLLGALRGWFARSAAGAP